MSNSTGNFTFTESFCGPEGFAFYGIREDGKFLSDCVREIFTGAIVHGIFLLVGWFRIVHLWDKPKMQGGFIGFWRNQHAPISLKILMLIKILCLVACTLFVGRLLFCNVH
jgi:hypothetical protein